MFVLDTHILLFQLGDRLAADPPIGEIMISVITEIELLSYPPLSFREAGKIRALLQELAIVGISRNIVDGGWPCDARVPHRHERWERKAEDEGLVS